MSSNSLLTKSVSKTDIVIEMETAAGKRDWEYLKTFFTDGILYKVGASKEMRGIQDLIDYVSWLFSNAIPRIPFYFRGVWEMEDTVIIEMDATFTRSSDGKPISFPCVDILRFEGNKIREWRVYPDQKELWLTDKIEQDAQKVLLTKVLNSTTKWLPSKSERMPGMAIDLVKQLFSRGESFDTQGFTNFFTDTPFYQFGNFEVCLDKAAIQKSVENLFSKISAVYHEIKKMWEIGNTVFVEMDVTYWRKDGSVISLPCCDIFRLEGDKFSELRIFMDVNPVFDSNISVPDTASVLTVSGGERLTPPNIMKQFFTEHPESKKRSVMGLAPKWATYSNSFLKFQSAASVSQLELVMEMEKAAVNKDWEYFKTFFTNDVLFKVGASQDIRGYQGIADYLSWLYSLAYPQLPFEFRETWELEGVVIREMDAKSIRHKDGKPISFPCTDILRFENNMIREWRIYPDHSELWLTEKVKRHGSKTYQ
jgi:ketosteroid isomerase-like protein